MEIELTSAKSLSTSSNALLLFFAALLWLGAAVAVYIPTTFNSRSYHEPPSYVDFPDADRTAAGDVWVPLYPGVDLAHWIVEEPLYHVFSARIDLWHETLRMETTSRNPRYMAGKRETRRQTTVKFLEENHLNFAINTNYYKPFNYWTIRSSGDAVLGGLAKRSGEVVSPAEEWFVSMLFYADGRAPEIRYVLPDDDVSDVCFAFSGRKRTLIDGAPSSPTEKTSREPRTAVGLSYDRRYLYFIVIDGRQPGYSLGATMAEEGRELLRCGAWNGFNLDGGGSSTMVVRGATGKGVVLNRPCNSTWSRLRHNGSAFGVATDGELLNHVRDGR